MNGDPRYYAAHADAGHLGDLLGDIGYTLGANGGVERAVVYIIVDEEDGIIGYALGTDSAQQIVKGLMALKEPEA